MLLCCHVLDEEVSQGPGPGGSLQLPGSMTRERHLRTADSFSQWPLAPFSVGDIYLHGATVELVRKSELLGRSSKLWLLPFGITRLLSARLSPDS